MRTCALFLLEAWMCCVACTSEQNSKVNINEASQAELETLPGIGPALASRIIEYREQNGKFNKIEDLQNVKGIGDAKFADIKNYVIVK